MIPDWFKGLITAVVIALLIASVVNAAPAQWFVVEWIVRVTPQTNFEDCTRMAEDRAKKHTAACLTAEQLAALKVKK